MYSSVLQVMFAVVACVAAFPGHDDGDHGHHKHFDHYVRSNLDLFSVTGRGVIHCDAR